MNELVWRSRVEQLQVHHTILPSGKRRDEISLPGSITKGCRPRTVYLLHPKAIDAFERYISWRLARKAGTALDASEYRGLMPQTRLILTQKASAFELSIKRRIDADGREVEYWAADSLQSYVTALYRAAGLTAGYSSHSGRRTFATRLIANGSSYEVVQMLLGHSHIDHLAPYVDVSPREIYESIREIDI